MNKEFFDAIRMLEKEKGIPADKLIEKVCNAIVVAARREFGVKEGIFCDFDPETAKMNIYMIKNVVEEIEDPSIDVLPEDALQYDTEAKVGDVLRIPLEVKDLGRIAAQTVKHVIRQGIREIEVEQVLEEFQSKKQDIVTAKINSVDPTSGDLTLALGKGDVLLPKKEQIPGESFKAGDMVKIYIVDVRETEKGPKIMISRTHADFVKRLFEASVPEIEDGTVEIKSISREAGSRTKIAVYSKDENVDPVGACIGQRGARVNGIINELHGEKIDIVRYSENPKEFVGAALAPAEVIAVEVTDMENKSCQVIVPENQLSLAIGNKGQNARLAVKLTGWKIDIKSYIGDYQPMIQL